MWAHCYMIVDQYKYNVSFYYFRKLLKFFIPRISSENKKDSKTRCLIFRNPMMNKSTNNLNTYVLSSNPPKIIINDAPQVNNLLVSNNYNSLMLFLKFTCIHINPAFWCLFTYLEALFLKRKSSIISLEQTMPKSTPLLQVCANHIH